MKKIDFVCVSKLKLIFTIVFLFHFSLSNSQTIAKTSQNTFWQQLQFGGGFGFNFGSGYSEITIAPSAIYPINRYVSLGTGLLASFTNSKNHYSTSIYGVSAIGLFNPIEKIQLSLELEQTRVNTEFKLVPNAISTNYWNTGLYVGAGFRSGNIILGGRYNLLFDKDKSIYSEALMPFVRFYF